jgi:ElaB/YqjD/DUF883 family membrane-anchored ribosome-binding protein
MAEQNFMNREQINDRINDTRQRVSQAVDDARAQASELGRAVADRVDEARDAAAGAMHDASENLHKHARNAAGMAHSAANRLDSAAGYVAEHDAQEMFADARTWIKRHPGKSVLVAVAVGFLMGRAYRPLR